MPNHPKATAKAATISRLKIVLLSLFLLLGAAAFAQASANSKAVVNQYIDNAALVGEGRLTYIFWDVYDASLYAPKGEWSYDKPFALTLHYLRDFEGADIANLSIKSIRKLGFDNEVKLATWHTQLNEIFPNVGNGNEMTGVYQPSGATSFYKDGQKIGVVKDTEFGEWFFDIWLSEKTERKELRKEVLGLK